MASKFLVSSASLLLALNLIFFTFVTSTHHHHTSCPPPPAPKPKCPPPPTPKSICPPPPPYHPKETCPRDALKLGVCANLLGGVVGVVIGTPPKKPCCALLEGFVDLEASICLCTAIKANVLGLNLNVNVDLSLLLNYCGKKVPTGFICA